MILVQRLNPRSLSGAPLSIWNRRVRLVYLDEAGVSKISEEPYLVIAGVILNADQDWRPLQRHLQSIARKYIPSEDRDNIIFHAKDIFHGSGYFVREKWDRPKRMEILDSIAEIPQRFHLPVAIGFVDRAIAANYFQTTHRAKLTRLGLQEVVPLPDSTVATLTYASSFVQVVESVDNWISLNASSEVAMLVAENTGKIQGALKAIHRGYSPDGSYDPKYDYLYTVRNIVDTVHFAAKRESVLLQLADTCAFIIKRHLMGRVDVASCFNLLKAQIISSLDPSRIACH
jgi:hypothetical protein